ncbi:MAG: NAD-dependent epimerase/dehydratase family protein [Clostridia bacterium]|nr:NAD-dependent epimerase/dehydratase family protein [Clostridia bacterium]
MSKILVTGAAGFIGSQLLHKLIVDGNEVVGIDNYSYGHDDNLLFEDGDYSKYVVKGDIRDKDVLVELFDKYHFDYVYNIAGIAPLPDCQSNPAEAISVNVGGFANILEFSRKYGVKTVVQASTNAMYENETEFPTTEDFKSKPTLIYPNTKYCAEIFAKSFCDTYDMNVCCVRFANVYGPHVDCLRKQPPFVGYLIRELYYNRTPIFHSTGNQARDYVYVDDLVNLLIAVQSCKGFDTVNCSTNTSYSVRGIYDIAKMIMGKNIEAEYVDSSNYWKKYPELYEGAYSIKQSILDHEVNKFSRCDNTYAKEKYGWVPKVDMYEGMKNMIEYQVELFDKLNK